jgi:hypothetical protein
MADNLHSALLDTYTVGKYVEWGLVKFCSPGGPDEPGHTPFSICLPSWCSV